MINGKVLAREYLDTLSKKFAQQYHSNGIRPKLSVLLVGDNPASAVYVHKKILVSKKIGIISDIQRFSNNVTESELLACIESCNRNPSIHGILLQLPLPLHMNTDRCIQAISPYKDVDGFAAINLGNFIAQRSSITPCTPKGVIRLIEHALNTQDFSGKNALVIGRSLHVGLGCGILLLHRHATCTFAHSRTSKTQLDCAVSNADIVIVAVGKANFFSGQYLKKDAIVIDVGIHRLTDGSLCGDVDYQAVLKKTSYITPVPGGVGPMTIAMLMENLYDLYTRHTTS